MDISQFLHFITCPHTLHETNPAKPLLLIKTRDDLINSEFLMNLRTKKEEIVIIGPAKESVYRIENEYRLVMYVKSKEKDILKEIRRKLSELCSEKVYMQFDIDYK